MNLALARCLAVMLGGAFGSLARYLINVWFGDHWTRPFPLATFLINVTGSFLIGIAYTALPQQAPILRPLLIAGILGGYTTFSAFELETLLAPRATAALYVVASVGVGLAACWLGATSGRWWSR